MLGFQPAEKPDIHGATRKMRPALVLVILAVAALGASPAPVPKPVAINDATEAELMTVPGVTREIARRIIERRPYGSVDDLVVSADLPIETVRVAHQRFVIVGYVIPSAPPASKSAGKSGGLPSHVDVNSASEEVLTRELGLERNTARRLVAARPYSSIRQFLAVADLPPTKVRALRSRLALDPPAPPPSAADSTSRVSAPHGGPRSVPTRAPAMPLDARIDVNTAPFEELRDACGVGAMNAQRILRERPYRSMRDVQQKLGASEETVRLWFRCLRVSGENPK